MVKYKKNNKLTPDEIFLVFSVVGLFSVILIKIMSVAAGLFTIVK